MSNILNQELINACIDEINTWKTLPKENHIKEPQYIDLNYQHILFLYTLKNIYDIGMEKSDLARELIMELDYWTDASPYSEAEDYDQMKQRHLNNRIIANTGYINNRAGWNLIVQDILDSKLSNTELMRICQWNDSNGDWYNASELELIGTIVQWAQEANI